MHVYFMKYEVAVLICRRAVDTSRDSMELRFTLCCAKQARVLERHPGSFPVSNRRRVASFPEAMDKKLLEMIRNRE